MPITAFLQGCEGSKTGGSKAPADSQRAGTLVLDAQGGRISAPELFNPFVPGFTDDAGFQQALAEPLFILNYQTGKVESWLGASFDPSPTHDEWVLKLRDGIKWSDGEAYDADDIVFTINLLLKNSTFTFAAGMQQWVSSVEKVDPLTVRFKLKKPNPRFQIDYFSVKVYNSVVIVPEHIWSKQDALKFTNYDPTKKWPVFTGPYRLTSTSATLVEYERRADWWGVDAKFMKLPEPERLQFVVNETEDVRIARAIDHQLDSIADMTAGAYESLTAKNSTVRSWLPDKPWAWADPCTRMLSFNTTVAPWNDPDMRWAINYAIDRDEIVKIAYEGTTKPCRFFFPPYPPLEKYVDAFDEQGLFEKYPIDTHDAGKAQQIIESKGYTRKGKGFYQKGGTQLRMQIDSPTEFVEIWRYADVVAEQLQRIGVNATVRKLASSTWGDNLAFGKFEAASDWSACGSVTEPYSALSLFTADKVMAVGKRANSNNQRWKNEAYSTAVESIAELPVNDPAAQDSVVKAAALYLRDLPFIPLTFSRKLYGFDEQYWTGWATSEDDYLQPTLDWANAHKIIHNLKRA